MLMAESSEVVCSFFLEIDNECYLYQRVSLIQLFSYLNVIALVVQKVSEYYVPADVLDGCEGKFFSNKLPRPFRF